MSTKPPFALLPVIMPVMHEGVMSLRADGTIAQCNDVAARLIRLDDAARARRLVGTPMSEACRLRPLQQIVEEALVDGEAFRGEINNDSGHIRRVDVCVMPRLQKGKVTGVAILLMDRTEVWRLERVRQDFVANVSHELRTPIAAIRGWSETLATGDFGLPEFVTEQVVTINRNAERLTALVNDLLTLAKAESVGLERQFVEVRLRTLIDDVLTHQAQALDEKRMRVHVAVAAEVERIFSEPRALEYVLRNLTENAIKYSPADGEIYVTAEVRKKGRLRLSVRDTGMGIEKHHLPRLFERFYRVDKGRSRAVGGTGLGLAIVKHFASALGGDVRVYSEVGEGSEFVVRLPRESWQLPTPLGVPAVPEVEDFTVTGAQPTVRRTTPLE
ncbi:MAG: histidine kinase [Myxococcales bacterium]|nr:histidine kinase [Myxococcales bacterium]